MRPQKFDRHLVTQNLRHRRIDIHEASVQLSDEDAFADAFKERPVFLLAFPQPIIEVVQLHLHSVADFDQITHMTQQPCVLAGQIGESIGRPQFARNLRRAAEMTAVPDERILEIYNSLRPNRSTKAELTAIADELENKYGAKVCAGFVREAAGVYERRGVLKKD